MCQEMGLQWDSLPSIVDIRIFLHKDLILTVSIIVELKYSVGSSQPPPRNCPEVTTHHYPISPNHGYVHLCYLGSRSKPVIFPP